jgi:hypothetical protein
VVADGYHNAFTDLIYWREAWYLAYRQAQSHAPRALGSIQILRSRDAETWKPVQTVTAPGGDARDPKFIRPARGALGLVCGVYYPALGTTPALPIRPRTPYHLISNVTYTQNGTAWSTLEQAYRPNYWLWSTLPMPVPQDEDALQGTYLYGAAYHFGEEGDAQSIVLLRSTYGYGWMTMQTIYSGFDEPSEPVLFQPDLRTTDLACLVRTGKNLQLGRAAAPYLDWTWTDLGMPVHAGAVAHVAGHLVVAGRLLWKRSKPAPRRRRWAWSDNLDSLPGAGSQYVSTCRLWTLENNTLMPLLTLESSGDCAYPGLVYDPGRNCLLVSYYSQHDYDPGMVIDQPVPADVYVATLKVGEG